MFATISGEIGTSQSANAVVYMCEGGGCMVCIIMDVFNMIQTNNLIQILTSLQAHCASGPAECMFHCRKHAGKHIVTAKELLVPLKGQCMQSR